REEPHRLRKGDREIAGHTESNHHSLAGIPSDAREIELQPGRYRVLASRGPTWSVSTWEFELAAGQVLPLEIAPPRRLLAQPGWLAADLHVHGAPSDDSGLPLRQRIADFVAMGADVVVSTEHDNVVDYAPTIEAMGLSDQIVSVVGVEVTSTYRGPNTPHTAGHANVFPLRVQPKAYRGGAPRSQNLRLGQIAENIRSLPDSPILQLNHPREGGFDSGLGSFFSHLSVAGSPHDPTQPLDAPANRTLLERSTAKGLRDLDFDAVELLNGKSMESYRRVRADWFAFLLQGEIRTGTANSDSHNARQTVALPVNYVAYPNAARADRDWDPGLFIDSIRKGQLYGSTGPLLRVRLGQQEIGGRFEGQRGQLQIQVRAAPWVPVDEVRVFVNGALHTRLPLPPDGSVRIPLQFDADAFVTVEVEGRPGKDSIYAQVAPGYTPFAFTNPIFVDADEDGDWTPPGLPDPPPLTLRQPLDSP
nr:CehA/McbA family metallohydrolase [Myxococcota bacterium]